MSTLIEALKARIANPDTASELRDAAISQLRTLAANSDDRRSADALSILRELGVEFDLEPAGDSPIPSEPNFELSEAEEVEQFRAWSVAEGRRYFQRLFPCPHSPEAQDERFQKIRAYFGPRVQAAERAGDESLRKKLVLWTSWATLDAVM
jgi:hypothetical protein